MTATQLKSDIESLWKHVKKGNVKFKLYSLVIVLAMLLLPLCLTAQITFAEKPPVDNTPEWWHLKDEMLMPYDSTSLKIELYPTLEAYKKYIGQTLFYMEKPMVLFLSKNATQFVAPQNKYFDIIDVISLADVEYEKRFDAVWKMARNRSAFYDKFNIKIPVKYYDKEYGKYGGYGVAESKDFPVFVLRETETGDTFYSTCFAHTGGYYDDKKLSSPLILVGGFVKLKEEFVGQTILKMKSDKYKSLSERIEQKWTCVDVSIKEFGAYNDPQVALVLQSENDSEKEYLAYTEFLKRRNGTYIIREQYLKMEQEEQKKIQANREVSQQYEQEQAQYKQTLINKYGAATAAKILKGDLEIGMSKDVCKEITKARRYTVADKTATTETWVFRDMWGGISFALYFQGDKLVRIVDL